LYNVSVWPLTYHIKTLTQSGRVPRNKGVFGRLIEEKQLEHGNARTAREIIKAEMGCNLTMPFFLVNRITTATIYSTLVAGIVGTVIYKSPVVKLETDM